ncbi:MAG: C40 family peptidase [Clostridiales bacterium]|nr:C40 family peptidase [Clostridiales bacterium]
MRQHRKSRDRRLSVVIIAICTMITFPVLMIPVGLRESTPAGVVVGRAYAAAYPYNDQEEVYVEDWALVPGSSDVTDPTGDPDGTDPTADPTAEPTGITDPSTDPSVTDPTGESEGEGEEPDEPEEGYMPIQTVDPETGLALIEVADGETAVQESYFDNSEQIEKKYAGVLTAQIVQTYDSSNLPIELLDTTAFIPTDEVFYIKTTDTILKEKPNMDAVTVASVARSTQVTRIAKGDTWSLIRLESGAEGYVLTNSLSVEMVFNSIDRTVWVDASGLKLRSEPNTNCEVIKEMKRWTRLHCSGVANDQWYKVTLDDGTEGYVYKSYTTQKPPPTPTPKPTPKPKSSGKGGKSGGGSNNNPPPKITGVNGESIVNIAKSMLGVDYVWCGESKGGVDCSGLVVYCYRQVGLSVPHQSNSIKTKGSSVDRSELRLGDVIVYDLKGNDGTADHVAIYAGNGQVIHASSSKDAVVYGSLDMGKILTYRRFIG